MIAYSWHLYPIPLCCRKLDCIWNLLSLKLANLLQSVFYKIQPLSRGSISKACTSNQQNRVTKLQKQAARLILDADLSIPYSDLFKKLKWLPFPKYVEYKQTVTVYKSLNELNPHYMNKPFSYTQDNHSYGTRNTTSSLLALPKCNKSIGQKCISYCTLSPKFGMA